MGKILFDNCEINPATPHLEEPWSHVAADWAAHAWSTATDPKVLKAYSAGATDQVTTTSGALETLGAVGLGVPWRIKLQVFWRIVLQFLANYFAILPSVRKVMFSNRVEITRMSLNRGCFRHYPTRQVFGQFAHQCCNLIRQTTAKQLAKSQNRQEH